MIARWMKDSDEYVRAWAVQLAVDVEPAIEISDSLIQLAKQDRSLLVQRYLASAIPKLNPVHGWELAATQASNSDLAVDTDLTRLIWFGVAEMGNQDPDRMHALSNDTVIPNLRDYILWYSAKQSAAGRDRLVHSLIGKNSDEQLQTLELLQLAIRGMRGLAAPSDWKDLSRSLYASRDSRVRQSAEFVGSIFEDQLLFQRMRETLSDSSSDLAAKRDALVILKRNTSDTQPGPLLTILDDPELVADVIPHLSKFRDEKVADALIARLPRWAERHQRAGLSILSSRPEWAARLLDAIENNRIPLKLLSAFDVRQISSLNDNALQDRLTSLWGSLSESSEELRNDIRELVRSFNAAPLWAYNAGEGARHFQKLCASCHQPESVANRLAPKLLGSGSKGITYMVENIIDPNAVIGRDFQARNVLTTSGQVITGLIQSESNSAVTIRTAADSVTIAKDEIDSIRVSDNSFMPEGLLQPLNEREKLELLKYLMSL